MLSDVFEVTNCIRLCLFSAIYVSVNEFGLPVGKFLSEKEMVNPEVDHIGKIVENSLFIFILLGQNFLTLMVFCSLCAPLESTCSNQD